MASLIPPMLVEIRLETAQIKQGLAQVQADMKKMGDSATQASAPINKMTDNLKNMAKTAGLAFGAMAVVNFAKQSIMAASDMNESISKVNVVFGDTSKAVLAFGKTAASSMGMSSQAALEATGTYGNLFQALGVTKNKSQEMSIELVKLAADMASFNNTSTKEALDSLRSGISGQPEALKRFGIAINETTLKTKAMEMGFGAIKGAMDPAIKAQVTYALVLEQTKLSQGDYARTADGAANTMKTLQARFEDAKVALGQALLPAFQALLAVLNLLVPVLTAIGNYFTENSEAIKAYSIIIGIAVGALVAYRVTVISVMAISKLYTAVVKAQAAGHTLAAIATMNLRFAMLALNMAIRANPIGAIVTAVLLLGAAFVAAYKKSETFREVIQKALSAVIGALGKFVGAVATVFEAMSKIPGIGSKFDGVAKSIRGASEGLKDFAEGLTAVHQSQEASNAALGLSGSAFAPKIKEETTITGGGKTAKEIAAELKKKQEALAKLYDTVFKTYDKMDKVISDSGEKRVKITAGYEEKILKLKADSLQRVSALEIKALADRNNAELKAADERVSIIKRGQDMLRNAFAAGASFDLAEMLKDTDKSGVALLTALKNKLAAVSRLRDNAYRLAGAGFSQNFIQEIVKNGPTIGSEMADAVLNSSSDVQAQLKELYLGLEDVSKYGLDKLAAQMSTSTSFATQELMDEYNNVNVQLQKTFAQINSDLRTALAEDAITLKDALIEAQRDFNSAITELEKDTIDKLRTLQTELAKTAAQIAGMQGASVAVSLMANAPAAPRLAGVAPLAPSNANTQPVGNLFTVNQTNNINGQTSVEDITSATISAIKFGSITRSISSNAVQGMIRGAG